MVHAGKWSLLWGGIPFICPDTLTLSDKKDDFQRDIKFVKSLKIISDLSEQIAFQEMVDWKLLDENGSKQMVTYKDGTTVAVDFTNLSYSIKFYGQKDIKGAFRKG